MKFNVFLFNVYKRFFILVTFFTFFNVFLNFNFNFFYIYGENIRRACFIAAE